MSLAHDIGDMLAERGPMEAGDVRAALGVASASRFEAGVIIGIDLKLFERASTGPINALRVIGDARPLPKRPDKYLIGKTRTVGSRYGADHAH